MKPLAITRSGSIEALTNVSLAGMFGAFAYAHALRFASTHRPSLIVILVLEALFAILVLVRAPASKAACSWWDWATTLGGTFTPLLLRPTGALEDAFAGQLLQVVGGAIAIHGTLCLNRSFGLLPAHRELKRSGPYRWVRHPLYSGYTIANVGYLLSNLDGRNLLLVLAALGFQLLRIVNEERFLSQYPAYAEYKACTRWRLFPFVY